MDINRWREYEKLSCWWQKAASREDIQVTISLPNYACFVLFDFETRSSKPHMCGSIVNLYSERVLDRRSGHWSLIMICRSTYTRLSYYIVMNTWIMLKSIAPTVPLMWPTTDLHHHNGCRCPDAKQASSNQHTDSNTRNDCWLTLTFQGYWISRKAVSWHVQVWTPLTSEGDNLSPFNWKSFPCTSAQYKCNNKYV